MLHSGLTSEQSTYGKPELVYAIDFVIVNSRLHDEFDQFKKAEVQPSYSFLPVVELLLFY